MGRSPNKSRVGDITAMLRAASTASPAPEESVAIKREAIADLCRLLGRRMKGATAVSSGKSNGKPTPGTPLPPLSPRLKQTLERLLAGDSEKQIARHLALSQHTIHVYVKALYKGFAVSSRAELLSRFIETGNGLSEKTSG